MPALPAEGDRPGPPRGVFRMNVILKTLHVQIVQECDSTWFTGASSCQGTPVLFVYRSEGESCMVRIKESAPRFGRGARVLPVGLSSGAGIAPDERKFYSE